MGNCVSAIKHRLSGRKGEANDDGASNEGEPLRVDGAPGPHKVSLDKPFVCGFVCPAESCNKQACSAPEDIDSEVLKKENHQRCWCEFHDDIKATRLGLVNSQLLEAAHNGTLSKPMKRQQGPQGVQLKILRGMQDMKVEDWLRTHLRPATKRRDEEEEDEDEDEDEEAYSDLAEFLHVLEITSVEDLAKLDVEHITYFELDQVLQKQTKVFDAAVEDLQQLAMFADAQQRKKRKGQEEDRLARINAIAESDAKRAKLRAMRQRLKRKLDLDQVLDHLLEKKASVNVFDRNGITALHYAARNGHKDDIRLLLQHNADPTIVDLKGNSVLHFAAMFAPSWAAEDIHAPPHECTKKHEKKEECPYGAALKVLKKAYRDELGNQAAKQAAGISGEVSCASKKRKEAYDRQRAEWDDKEHTINCQNSSGKTPKELLLGSIAQFETEAKDIEKARKKGGDVLQQIEVVLDGARDLSAERQFLEFGTQHAARVKKIAKTHFSKIPKVRKHP